MREKPFNRPFRMALFFPFLLSLSFVILGHAGDTISGKTIDHGIYAGLLKAYVKGGFVDYRGFKDHEAELDAYLKILEKTDTNALPRNEQFAFYINAYNAWTIKLILSRYPDIKSIKDIGGLFWKSPWKRKICRIDDKVLTLDDIEHKILRPRFKDARVHFAVNCASKGCPPLRSEPYRGDLLDQQLDESAKAFINSPKWNRLEDRTLFVSEIFKWFKQDFDDDIKGFFVKYAGDDLKNRLMENFEEIGIKYLDYDWSLNSK